ncbi:hypothetical protein DPMN_094807 [Dreissena polymorpha]|uniref:Uncharacterized protein n=1 Tax=Dreissena polymorpha TaxID=45954 RepID=A0A9D4R364_DREPO|nr:hypothetical protein DPMN_094807 [Dreissena polymorpha]
MKTHQQHVRCVHRSLEVESDWLQEDPGDLIEGPNLSKESVKPVVEAVKPVVTEGTVVIKEQVTPDVPKEGSAVKDSAKPRKFFETLAFLRKPTKPLLPGPPPKPISRPERKR